jgi:hypothetical protein
MIQRQQFENANHMLRAKFQTPSVEKIVNDLLHAGDMAFSRQHYRNAENLYRLASVVAIHFGKHNVCQSLAAIHKLFLALQKQNHAARIEEALNYFHQHILDIAATLAAEHDVEISPGSVAS